MKNFDAVRYIYPDAIFSMVDDDPHQITWVGQEYEIPTAEQIANAISELGAIEAAKVNARESALAKLAALGLTVEEIAAL
jgi:DNA-binding NarL/FixJ family response regulator